MLLRPPLDRKRGSREDNLQCAEGARRDVVVARQVLPIEVEGDRAAEREPLAGVHAGEERETRMGVAGKQNDTKEGEGGTGVRGNVGVRRARAAQARNEAQQGDEDDDESGEKGGFRGGGAGEAGGLEFVAEGKQEAGDCGHLDVWAGEGLQGLQVNEDEDEGGKRHAKQVEEQR